MNVWTFLDANLAGIFVFGMLSGVVAGGFLLVKDRVTHCQDETTEISGDYRSVRCDPGATMRADDKRVFCSCAKADGGM